MNRITAIALLTFATSMMAGSASAQGAALKAKVPFNFTVNNVLLPAGSYELSFDSKLSDLLVVEDGTKSVRARALGERGAIGPGKPDMLIFHRYGGEYFLSEVHFGSGSNGVFLPAAKLERQTLRAGQKEELAFVGAN